ncbi:conserved hypothetical protein [Neospora caninum Liverpool]|uniref:Uncharacterized protein n=1 Tax=Neospora caninum (strain Liverpool) TaxID=572307 RepID=F0VBQ4_NEOCL|nr:conserved hypothetical protein [Neospora caninum Liverpool]CBZ51038.1 conserved hypothetical protein [Neospora caninum Liverpool]CEL68344.1 TPA: hypothetical protein BN1204_041130 [Neospora caninum Liverpool]|eukprot:XP_003881071.1 conserved hypothetical protein [Neospora caninum Liverpool]
MEPQTPANPPERPCPLPLQLLQRHTQLLAAQQLRQAQASPAAEASPQPRDEKDAVPVVPAALPIALFPPPLRPLTPEQLQRQQLLQQHLRQRQLQHLQLFQAGLQNAAQDPAAPQRAADLLQKELERQRRASPPLHGPARLLQLHLQQRLLLQAAARHRAAAAGEAPLRPPPAVAAAAAAAVRRGALQLLLMPRPAANLGQSKPPGPVAIPEGSNSERAETAGGASNKSVASAEALPKAPGPVFARVPSVAPLLAASSLWALRPPSIRPAPNGVPGGERPKASPNQSCTVSGNGSRPCRETQAPATAPGVQSRSASGRPEQPGSKAASGGSSVKKEHGHKGEGEAGEKRAADAAGPPAAPSVCTGGGDSWSDENNWAGAIGGEGARKKAGEAVQDAAPLQGSPPKKGNGKKRDEEEDESSGSGEEDVYRYHEDEHASDAVKRRHTLEMPIGWGVRKPVAEATGNGGAFKKTVWVNEIVGGIRRQVYQLEKTKEWCVQFFRSSGSDTRTVTRKFPEDGVNRFRAIAAAYNLMPWDCTGTDYRRPQGRPLKRRVFTAADFEEGTAWYHYPPSLSRHPYPLTAPPGSAVPAAPGRPRRRAEAPLLQPLDLAGDTPHGSPLGSPSCSFKLQTPPDALLAELPVARGAGRLTGTSLANARSASSRTPLTVACDASCAASHRVSVTGSAASASAAAGRASPRLSPWLLDAAASVAAAAFRLHGGARKRRRGDDSDRADESASSDPPDGSEADASGDSCSRQEPLGAAPQPPLGGRGRQKTRRDDPRDGALFGWVCGQSAGDMDDGETGLLRQLILDQVEEEPPECMATWSKALLPWPLASPLSTAPAPYSKSTDPSSASQARASSFALPSRYDERDGECFHRESGRDADSSRVLPTNDTDQSTAEEMRPPARTRCREVLPPEKDPWERDAPHMALPPAPCSSLSRLFCHFCCAPDRREALGRSAFAKVVEVVFPNALETSLRPSTSSTQHAGHPRTEMDTTADLCHKLAKREQTLENYVLISRILRALAKKENDSFFRRLHSMFQAHVATCTSSGRVPSDTVSSGNRPRPLTSAGLSESCPSASLPLDGEANRLSVDDPLACVPEDQAKVEGGAKNPQNGQTSRSASGGSDADTVRLKKREATQCQSGSDATAAVSRKAPSECYSAYEGRRDWNKSGAEETLYACECLSEEPVLLQKAGKFSGTPGDVLDSKERDGNATTGGSAMNTGGGCHTNGNDSRPRLREPTVTEVLRVLGWILDIDEDREGMR